MKLSSTSNLRCMATSKWYLWLHWFREASFWIEIKHRFFDVAFTPVFTDVSMHRPALVQRFFVNHQIELLSWPARSPDLSPIENMSMVAQRLTQITPPAATPDQL
ncbi:multidrug resistance protein 1 [Trichonephila clavipes]|nr:multidrug resistance protein 1 [Trichonephila clavipes]